MHSDDRLTKLPPPPPALPSLATCPDISPPVTILVVVFVVFVYVFWPLLTMQLLMWAGLGPPPAAPDAGPTLAFMRLKLLAVALAFPLQVALVLLLLPRFASVRLEQIGLTPRDFGRNCLRGVVGALLIYPASFGLNYLVMLWLTSLGTAASFQEHPFVQMSQNGLSLVEWILLVFSAAVAGPVMEELVFRGALQSWLEGRAWAPHLVMALAVFMSIPFQGDLGAIWSQGPRALALHFAPSLFVLVLGVIYGVICLRSRGLAGPAVFATSTLFAAVHSGAWPSPVALFVMALPLGILAQRTRSLVGPIVLHSLFNAVSCVMLFLPITRAPKTHGTQCGERRGESLTRNLPTSGLRLDARLIQHVGLTPRRSPHTTRRAYASTLAKTLLSLMQTATPTPLPVGASLPIRPQQPCPAPGCRGGCTPGRWPSQGAARWCWT